MATNEAEELPQASPLEAAQTWLVGATRAVTDTGPGLPLRVWVLMVVIGVACVVAPFPANVIGVAATVALAMSAPARARGGR